MNRETYDQFATFEHQGRTLTRAPRFVIIEHEGLVYDPDARPGRLGWAHEWGTLTPEAAEERRAILADGTFWRDAEQLTPAQTNYERAKILRTYDGLPSAFASRPSGAVREYIPGLMRHGSIPSFTGPPKAGKSLVVGDLAAALVIDDYRFLDHFEPVNVTPAERARPVVLANAENPEADEHEALLATGLEYHEEPDGYSFYSDPHDDNGDGTMLFVVHLLGQGGAGTLDLRNPDVYDWWQFELSDLARRFGMPLTMIVDGVTAILGSDTTQFGAWNSEFRRLLRSLDIPNGLATGHNGLTTGHTMGGVESMAGQDGLWFLEAPAPFSNPNAQRTFKWTGRLRAEGSSGGSVEKGPDGRLRLNRAERGAEQPFGRQNDLDATRAYLRDQINALMAAGHDATTKAVCGSGKAFYDHKPVLEAMERDGEVRSEPGKKQGYVWFLVTPDRR